jgi:hypothetical protein
MAYAYCPKCQKSFRFRASAHGQARWLKDVAASLGSGEKPNLLCLPCWLVPRAGDPVRVLEPPSEPNALQSGATGTVIEVQLEGTQSLFLVQGFSAKDGTWWRHRFRSSQLQAYITSASSTIKFRIALSDA